MIENDDAAYFLRRARQEAQAAIAAIGAAAASAHRSLSNHYAAKALLAHVDTDRDSGSDSFAPRRRDHR